ncbi:unnamed protein product, partial [Brassica oleracea]
KSGQDRSICFIHIRQLRIKKTTKMSEPSQASDPCALIGIVKNPDGTITRDPTRFPCVPAAPDPSPQVMSKDIIVSDSTWMRLYLPTTAQRLPKQKLSLRRLQTLRRLLQPHGARAQRGRRVTFVPASSRAQLPAAYHDGADALTFIRKSDDEWIKSHVYLFNVFLMGTGSGGNLAYSVGHRPALTNVLDPLLRICGLILHHPFFGGEERCESEIRHVNDRVFPPAVGDVCWELCLPVGENRDHAYSNPTMGDGLEILGALKWKVMVCGGGGDPMIDMQRNVAKLMKEKELNVVERFTDGDVHGAELGDPCKSQTLFASFKSFISSTPYRF